MDCRDFAILILSHGRPEFLKSHTWHILDKVESKARRIIVLSDDDKTISEYRKMYGKENVATFNKIEVERKHDIDTIDCYWGSMLSRKSPLWARNAQFDIARKMGYRWFIVLDDDYREMVMRKKMIRNDDKTEFFPTFKELIFASSDEHGSCFDKCCVKYFEVLNSAPWLYATAMAQCGDFVGGINSIFTRFPYRWKAMNVFFCDTEKEYRFYGKLNDDVNGYIMNGRIGQMSLTMFDLVINQEPTQKASGGITDLYRTFGTYIKSLASIVACPSSVSISCMGSVVPRVHHCIQWSMSCPVVLNDSLCREKPLDFQTECLHDSVRLETERKFKIADEKCEVIEDASLTRLSVADFC